MTDGRVRERQEDFEEAQRRALQDLKAESRKGSTRHSPAGHLYGTDELSRTGVHEAGHALAAWSTCYAASLFAITVGENGGKTGIIWRSTSNATGLYWEWMVSCLGGIAAEMTVYGRFRSGESRSDLILARAYAEKIWETEIRDGSRE